MTVELRDSLSFDDILLLAERATGAYGVADEGLLARLRRLVDKFNERGPYAPYQIEPMQHQFRRMLEGRLRMMLDRQRYPGIAEEKIDRPIFIIGFPRSGTTLLHALLAEDPQAMKVQSWNVFSPSPPPGAGPVCAERIAFSQRRIEEWMDFCPGHKTMHPYIDKGAMQLCENEEAFSLDLHTAYPFQYFRVPTLEPSEVLAPDAVEAYRFFRELLQHLQWNTGKSHWVCKEPSAQLHVDALFEVFPDALCVWAHRPIVECYASGAALRAVTYDTIRGRPNDWTAQPRRIVQNMKKAFDELLASDLIRDPRIVHLPFRELAADPFAVVQKIYERAGRTVTPEYEASAKAWLADPENAIDRHGRYTYSYEALGLDREWVDELFTDYSRYFGLD